MNDYLDVIVLVEGQTESIFVKNILAPYLGRKNIGMTPIVVSKPGQNGGDIRFDRVRNDIEKHLKQRSDTYLTLLIDFYGIKRWPDYDAAKMQETAWQKARAFLESTKYHLINELPDLNVQQRFIPYVSMHEFEALLFSDVDILSQSLGISAENVEAVLTECGSAENINDTPETIPSRRIEHLNSHFKKTSSGIAIAEKIGIEAMRKACPIFNDWLIRIESLSPFSG